MGVNAPARAVAFAQLRKHDGAGFRGEGEERVEREGRRERESGEREKFFFEIFFSFTHLYIFPFVFSTTKKLLLRPPPWGVHPDGRARGPPRPRPRRLRPRPLPRRLLPPSGRGRAPASHDVSWRAPRVEVPADAGDDPQLRPRGGPERRGADAEELRRVPRGEGRPGRGEEGRGGEEKGPGATGSAVASRVAAEGGGRALRLADRRRRPRGLGRRRRARGAAGFDGGQAGAGADGAVLSGDPRCRRLLVAAFCPEQQRRQRRQQEWRRRQERRRRRRRRKRQGSRLARAGRGRRVASCGASA